MNYVVGEHYDKFIRDQVALGRFESGEAVVEAGLRLVEARESKLQALRDHVEAAIAEGGGYTDEELDEILAAEDKD